MRIRIFKVPDGDPPYWVRKEMLDLEFQLETKERATVFLQNAGATPEQIAHRDYLVVSIAEVLRILREKKLLDAALWFEQNKEFEKKGIIFFEKKNCIELP